MNASIENELEIIARFTKSFEKIKEQGNIEDYNTMKKNILVYFISLGKCLEVGGGK